MLQASAVFRAPALTAPPSYSIGKPTRWARSSSSSADVRAGGSSGVIDALVGLSLNSGGAHATTTKSERGAPPPFGRGRGAAGSGLAAVAAMRSGGGGSARDPPISPTALRLAPLIPPPAVATVTGGDMSVPRVAQWLTELGLGAYASTFSIHEISGATLMGGLSERDLDTLGVLPLGHRKALLAAVEGLRGAERVHWSHLAPLQQQPASPTRGSGGQGASSTSGSGAAAGGSLLDGEFDEEGERAAFQAALLAWRRGGKAAAAVAAAAAAGTAATSVSEANKRAEGGGGVNSDGGLWVNPFAIAEPPSPLPAVSCLADGEYDEAREAAAFQAAVMAWRQGAAMASAPTAAATAAASTNAGSGALRRVVCYQCLKSFYGTQAGGKAFCTPACEGLAAAALAEHAARAAALRAEQELVEAGGAAMAAPLAHVPPLDVAVADAVDSGSLLDMFAAAADAGSLLPSDDDNDAMLAGAGRGGLVVERGDEPLGATVAARGGELAELDVIFAAAAAAAARL